MIWEYEKLNLRIKIYSKVAAKFAKLASTAISFSDIIWAANISGKYYLFAQEYYDKREEFIKKHPWKRR